jgi:hypothetical protein
MLTDHLDQPIAQRIARSTRFSSSKRRLPPWNAWTIAGTAILAALFVIAVSKTVVSRPVPGTIQNTPRRSLDATASTSNVQSLDPSFGGTMMQKSRARNTADSEATISSALPSSPALPMIARTASLTILVKDFATARTSLDLYLAKHSGYAASLSINTPENEQRQFQASLRIPANELASALASLKSLGRVLNENQSGEELTQQHADLIARLQNSRETEQRLRDILQRRTGKIEDVLQVEEEISRVRGEIESMESEQKALEHRVTFATVDLRLVEEFREKFDGSTTSTSGKLHNAFISGMRNATGTLLGLILFLEEFGPAILLWAAILGIPAYLIWRRYRPALTPNG